jgi:hypothetical protein
VIHLNYPAGNPLPHAWIDDEDGTRRPVKDLVGPGRFLLIAGEDGQAWCQAARELAAEAGLPLDAVRIGHLDGDYHDPRCATGRSPATARSWSARTGSSPGATRAGAGDPGPSWLPRSAGSSPGRWVGWPVRHGLGLVLSNLLQVRFPACLIIFLQGPSDGRVLLLSHLHLSLGQFGLGLFGLRLGPCGLRPGPCLRLGLAAFAGDSRLGCLLTTVSWLRSLNEHTCLALDHEAAAQRAAVRGRSHAGDPRGTRCCPEAFFTSKSTIFACPQEG